MTPEEQDKFFDDLPPQPILGLVPFEGPRLEMQVSINRLKKLFESHPEIPVYDKKS